MHATVESFRPPVVEPLPLPPPKGELARPEKWRNSRRSLTSITILAWTVRLSAVINLLAAAQAQPSRVVYWLSSWMPFEISAGRPLRMILAAILLFALSSGLERGKRIPWLLTIGTLLLAPFMHLGRTVIWPQLLLNLPLILLLWANRRFFVAKSNGDSLRSALMICPVLLFALLIFGTVRLHDVREETTGPDSWGGCFQAACELVFVHNAETQKPLTAQAKDLFFELRAGGNTVAIIALFLSLRPAVLPHEAKPEGEESVGRVVRRYGRDPLHAYTLLGDKMFFFNADRTVVLPYVMSGRFAVILAGPIGPTADHLAAMREFNELCRRQDWVPLYYQFAAESMALYQEIGFSCLQIGEDARLDAEQFDLKGGAFQNLRTLCNKAQKQGLQFLWYDESVPVDAGLEEQLSEISRVWLEQKNANEMSFDMGSFCREDLRRNGAGIALSAEGQALAFTTWRPFDEERGRVVDLMRSLPAARNVLDFVLVESIRHFQALGVYDISLGNAPLANARNEVTPASVEDHAIRFIYENLNQVYAYKPLFEFKRKYRPQWRARYLAYPPGESLPLIGLALVRVHTRQGPLRFLTG